MDQPTVKKGCERKSRVVVGEDQKGSVVDAALGVGFKKLGERFGRARAWWLGGGVGGGCAESAVDLESEEGGVLVGNSVCEMCGKSQSRSLTRNSMISGS